MKTNGRIHELLAISCSNDNEYGHQVIWPLMDYLGIPSQARRPQFQIENPFGAGLLRLDYLIHVGDLPMVTIEGEPHTHQFEQGFKQARNYSINFKPHRRDSMREMTVPFLIVAAGGRAEMRRAVLRGLTIEYEPILDNGKPAFLEWHELQAAAGEMRPAGAVRVDQQVVIADLARQFFNDLYEVIDRTAALRNQDDRKMILFNGIIDGARDGQPAFIQRLCHESGLRPRAIDAVLCRIDHYQEKIEANEFSGPAVARGYRNFLVQPGGRGTHQFFTGESQHRPYRAGRAVRYRNVARYFTPTEIIQQMVRLANPQSHERVIDITCGSGGFPAECVDYIARAEGPQLAQEFLVKRLVAIDDDPFCVSCTRELLTLLYPRRSRQLKVFLHNSLYKRAPIDSEIEEDLAAERHLRGGYDLVIGNPPGNDEYSGTNPGEIARQWTERFGHDEGGLMDHHCFIRRAVELARPDGGRICMLVPESLLTRDNRGIPELRRALMRECELRAVIALPQIFKNNNARMAILYLVRNPNWNAKRKVLLASVQSRWKDDDGTEHTTDLFGELESIVSRYLAEVEPQGRNLPPGRGLADFPETPPATGEVDIDRA
jgi:N-6 DNA methylase